MTHILSLTLFAYVLWRFVLPLPLSILVKSVLTFLFLLIGLKNFFFQYFFGGLSAPDLPRSIIMMGGWFFACLFFLFLFTIIRDIILILSYVIKHPISIVNGKTSFVIVMITLFCASYGLYEAVQIPSPKRIEIPFKNLPKALDGFTIVLLTDIHINRFNPDFKVKELVNTVNQQHPDLIVLTGDMVDGTVEKRLNDVAPLQALQAKYGVFGIVGNHEYYAQDYDSWVAHFQTLKINMLINSHDVIWVDQTPLTLVGITDSVANHFNKPLPDLDQALKDSPSTFRILLSHRPNKAQENAQKGIQLQLSGHTHGGQVIGLNAIVALMNKGFLQGLYDLHTMKLYISAGVCLWNGFPIRLGVPAEMPIIVLKNA